MKIYNITAYGAVPDKKTVCTDAIQRAIDLCGNGGTVYIPKGDFITGALFLKSNMTLYIEEGARLIGSGRLEDFPVMSYPFEGKNQLCYASLINTDGAPCENIIIDGKGTIDANGAELFALEMGEKQGKRGRAVCIRNAENVAVRNVTIRQSPAWCLHLICCRGVIVENIQVYTKYDENGKKYEGIFNGDGIDIDSCREVRISNSLIASQDDCIAVKSGKDTGAGVPSENITVENCVFQSGFGVAVGSEMSGGVRNVFVLGCDFENTHSIASIKTIRGRGGYIKNIHYENCSLVNRNTEISDTKWFRGAIYVDGFYGQAEFDPGLKADISEGTPEVDGIYFKDITIDTIGGNAIYLCGLPERPFKNISLENVKAHGKYGMKAKNIDGLRMIHVDVSGDEDHHIQNQVDSGDSI